MTSNPDILRLAVRYRDQLFAMKTFLEVHGELSPDTDAAIQTLIDAMIAFGDGPPVPTSPPKAKVNHIPIVERDENGRAIRWTLPGLHLRRESPDKRKND